MPDVFSTVSTKGGAGKTTVAILVAGELVAQGRSVTLIDADPNANLSNWWANSARLNNQPAGVNFVAAATGSAIKEAVARAARDSAVIIDTRGVNSTELNAAIEVSDLVLVPVQTNEDEIYSFSQVVQLVTEIQSKQVRKIGMMPIITRISVASRKSVEYRTIYDLVRTFSEMGLNIASPTTELYERQRYREIRQGLGFLQQAEIDLSVGKARQEVQDLVAELLAFHQTGRIAMAS